MLPPMVRMLDVIAATTDTPLVVHAPGCPYVALYEQAILTALRSLQQGSDAGFRVSMVAVVLLTALRVIRADMMTIARVFSVSDIGV